MDSEGNPFCVAAAAAPAVGLRDSGLASAELRRHKWGASKIPSIHNERENPNINMFFVKPGSWYKNMDDEEEDLYSNIDDQGHVETPEVNTVFHPNYTNTKQTYRPPSMQYHPPTPEKQSSTSKLEPDQARLVQHSFSAPVKEYQPLTKDVYDQSKFTSPYYRRVVSDQGTPRARSENSNEGDCAAMTQERRRSYKDSAYSSGKDSSESNTSTDYGSQQPSQPRGMAHVKLSSRPSQDLSVVHEYQEGNNSTQDSTRLEHVAAGDVSSDIALRGDIPVVAAEAASYKYNGSTDAQMLDNVFIPAQPQKQKASGHRAPDLTILNEYHENFVKERTAVGFNVSKPTIPDSLAPNPHKLSTSSSFSPTGNASDRDPVLVPPWTPSFSPHFQDRLAQMSGWVGQEGLEDQINIRLNNTQPVNQSDSDHRVDSVCYIESLMSMQYFQQHDPHRYQDCPCPSLIPGETSLLSVELIDNSKSETIQAEQYQRYLDRCNNRIIYRSFRKKSPEETAEVIQQLQPDTEDMTVIESPDAGEIPEAPSPRVQNAQRAESYTSHGELLTSDSTSYVQELTSERSWVSDIMLSSVEFNTEGKLLHAACCRQTNCTDVECQEGQRMMVQLTRCLNNHDCADPLINNLILRTIAQHANFCDELKCPIPWCYFFHQHDLPYEEQMALLHQKFFSGQINLTTDDSDINNVELLSSVDSGVMEHVDWTGIVHLGHYGNTVLAMTSSIDNPAYWVIKRETLGILQHTAVLRQLKRHPRITQHLWILEQDNFIFYAAKFEGISVSERMSESAQQGFPHCRVLKIMEQLASAAKFLHRLHILYLNWTAENVLLDARQNAKLCNFSCSVLSDSLQGEEEDREETMEDLRMSLNPRVIPPELYREDLVDAESDVWGLGCVWYEMTTAHFLYPEYRHCDAATTRDMVTKNPEPDLSEIAEDVRTSLSHCLKVDRTSRITTADLHSLLVHLIDDMEKA